MSEIRTNDVAAAGTANAAEVAHEAKAQAAQTAHVAGDEVQRAWRDVRKDLHQQASTQAGRAGEGLRRLESQLQALRTGDSAGAGAVGEYAAQAQQRIARIAQSVEADGFDGVVADLRRFARRRPGAFLVSAAAAGFVAGRLARGAAAAGSTPDAGTPSTPSSGSSGYAYGPSAMHDRPGATTAVSPGPADADPFLPGPGAPPTASSFEGRPADPLVPGDPRTDPAGRTRGTGV